MLFRSRLYAVTDRTWIGERTIYEDIEESLKGGATIIQLREKDLDETTFLDEAISIKKLCGSYNVPFIVNDNVGVAVASGADGVHVGQKDLDVPSVRAKIGEGKIIGVSTKTVEQALLAEKQGADYLGVGAMFTTSTKLDASGVDFETLRAICSAVSIPVVAIGGISKDNMMNLKDSGIVGVAVVSAIYAQKDIKAATGELLSLAKQL